MSRIYLATSWRNPFHDATLTLLRTAGHEVYDFKSGQPMHSGGPVPTAFNWGELDQAWEKWTPRKYRSKLLTSARAASGYVGDLRGMEWADTCIMLLPCGRSAHIEAGYCKGRGKRLIAYYVDGEDRTGFDPDLMYLLADNIVIGQVELIAALEAGRPV